MFIHVLRHQEIHIHTHVHVHMYMYNLVLHIHVRKSNHSDIIVYLFNKPKLVVITTERHSRDQCIMYMYMYAVLPFGAET